jgi:hypothetical protein
LRSIASRPNKLVPTGCRRSRPASGGRRSQPRFVIGHTKRPQEITNAIVIDPNQIIARMIQSRVLERIPVDAARPIVAADPEDWCAWFLLERAIQNGSEARDAYLPASRSRRTRFRFRRSSAGSFTAAIDARARRTHARPDGDPIGAMISYGGGSNIVDGVSACAHNW